MGVVEHLPTVLAHGGEGGLEVGDAERHVGQAGAVHGAPVGRRHLPVGVVQELEHEAVPLEVDGRHPERGLEAEQPGRPVGNGQLPDGGKAEHVDVERPGPVEIADTLPDVVDGDARDAWGGHGEPVSRATAPGWLDELVLRPGPPFHHMGLRTVDEADWLVVDERRPAELAEKRRLLDERHDEVFGALPGTEAAGAEALALVTGWLGAHHPDLRPEVTAGAGEPGGPDRHPLEQAGRLVQEDLCVMDRRGDDVCLVAASLCFPSHWRLAEKLGGSAAAIHGPVTHYAEELQAKVDRYLERLPVDRIGLRRNWTVQDHDTLFVPSYPPTRPGVDATDAGDHLWLRSERQTLRRLPTTGAVLFTIRVQVAPLGVLAQRPDVAHALAAALRSAGRPRRDRAPGHLDAACAWLEALPT